MLRNVTKRIAKKKAKPKQLSRHHNKGIDLYLNYYDTVIQFNR